MTKTSRNGWRIAAIIIGAVAAICELIGRGKDD